MSEQHQVRVEKVSRLREAGIEPYPAAVDVNTSLRAIREHYTDLGINTWTGDMVSIGGRIMTMRNGGNLCFAVLMEGDTRLQIMLERNTLGIDSLKEWKALTDLGDIVTITGEVGSSSTGELSVKAHSWAMASKCLQPMPDKMEGISDPELLRRSRHVDLLIGGESRTRLKARSTVMRSLRETLWGLDYDEVDTPVLQRTHGGASARPFVTEANALGTSLSLRIAPELYLKRLMVGGCERIFEIGPNFRNEGMDSRHSPEFMMLEAYSIWGDYNTMKDVMRSLILEAAFKLNKSPMVIINDREVDLSQPWRSATMHELVSEAIEIEIDAETPVRELFPDPKFAQKSNGEILVALFEELVEKNLEAPTFVTDWPIEVRPLTRAHRDNPALTESWDLIIGGREVGTAYSELIDPIEQRARLEAQSLLAAGGDKEAMLLDEEFLGALEYAMAPTGGIGLGIDRLIMLLSGVESIRDSITFPLLK